MPAYYDSKSHTVPMPCVILGRNPDGTFDLGDPEEGSEADNKYKILKKKADPLLVRPRPLNGWFAPMPPFMQDDPAIAAAAASRISFGAMVNGAASATNGPSSPVA